MCQDCRPAPVPRQQRVSMDCQCINKNAPCLLHDPLPTSPRTWRSLPLSALEQASVGIKLMSTTSWATPQGWMPHHSLPSCAYSPFLADIPCPHSQTLAIVNLSLLNYQSVRLVLLLKVVLRPPPSFEQATWEAPRQCFRARGRSC